MISLQEFTKMSRAVEAARRDADRKAGVLEQKTAELRTEFGCKDVAGAKKLLAKLRSDIEVREGKLTPMIENFTENYRERLG